MSATCTKPSTAAAMLREWREIGTTGSTDGDYGEDPSACKRKTLHDISWLIAHWGIDAAAIRALVGGVIEMGRLSDYHLKALLTACPDVARPVLDKMGLVHLALESRCATGSETTRRDKQQTMVSALIALKFTVEPCDQREVQALLRELEVKRAAAAELAAKQAAERRKVHPGRLVTHEADLSGLDSAELRHVEQFYQLWSCCKREPNSPGCQEPAAELKREG